MAMFVSLGPILTAGLGICLLGETINTSDIIQIALSFAVMVFITLNSLYDKKQLEEGINPSIDDDPENYARRDHFTIFLFLLLFMWPIGQGIQNILLRKMKKLNANTVSCYVNPIMGLFALSMLLILGVDTYKYIGDIVCNHYVVFILFIIMAAGLVMQ